MENSKIWLTSDFHFGHNREFIYRPRGYDSIYKMNEGLLSKFNSRIGENDIVYILGDLVLGGPESPCIEYIKDLKGHLNIILGNHDTNRRIEMYKQIPSVETIQYSTTIKYKGYHFYLSHYPTLTSNGKDESLRKCLINLYGHTHQSTNFFYDLPYMYHVGVDSHDGYPVLLDDIIKDCKMQVNKCKEVL